MNKTSNKILAITFIVMLSLMVGGLIFIRMIL